MPHFFTDILLNMFLRRFRNETFLNVLLSINWTSFPAEVLQRSFEAQANVFLASTSSNIAVQMLMVLPTNNFCPLKKCEAKHATCAGACANVPCRHLKKQNPVRLNHRRKRTSSKKFANEEFDTTLRQHVSFAHRPMGVENVGMWKLATVATHPRLSHLDNLTATNKKNERWADLQYEYSFSCTGLLCFFQVGHLAQGVVQDCGASTRERERSAA